MMGHPPPVNSGPAAYSLYDVLHALIDGVGFRTQEERQLCHDSVKAAERMGILGNLAQQMACAHETIGMNGLCADCGKIIYVKRG